MRETEFDRLLCFIENYIMTAHIRYDKNKRPQKIIFSTTSSIFCEPNELLKI